MTALDAKKLSRVLGMLGSAHDGEILAAARQAERIRRDAVTWDNILAPARLVGMDGRDDAIAELLANADFLTDWEIDFAVSIRNADYDLTEKQTALIERLLKKVRRAQGRAAA
jgi:hypothetical protein